MLIRSHAIWIISDSRTSEMIASARSGLSNIEALRLRIALLLSISDILYTYSLLTALHKKYIAGAHTNDLDRAYSPPRRGGVDARSKKNCEATLFRADGVVSSAKTLRPGHFAELPTPSAPTKEASQHLINVASTPPLRGWECCAVPVHSHLVGVVYDRQGFSSPNFRQNLLISVAAAGPLP